jgi:hypothetical protein
MAWRLGRGSSNVTLAGVNHREISTVMDVYATLKVGVEWPDAAHVVSTVGLERPMSAEWDEALATPLDVGAVPAGQLSAEAAAVALVGQALDDLEAERVDVAAALTLVATTAWRQGHDAAIGRSPDDVVGPDSRLMPDDDGIGSSYVVVAVDPATGEVDAEGPFTAVEAMVVADRVRVELDANGLSEFMVALTQLRGPR